MADREASTRSPARLSTASLSKVPSHEPGATSPGPASAPATGSSKFTESLLNSALATALAVPTTPTPTSGDSSRRQPLSIQTTTQNFKRFVAKSGPLFWLTDQAESILLWDDAYKTIFFALLWAILCYKPSLIALLPSGILMAVLTATYIRAHPEDAHKEAASDARRQSATMKPGEAAAGSVDYLDNLQHIQEVMGRAAHATDVGRSYLPLLDWSTHPQLSLLLFLVASAATVVLALVHHLIPWRLILALGGEALLTAGHPRILAQIRPLLQSKISQERFRAAAADIRLQYDALDDPVIDQGPQDLQIVEVSEEEILDRDGHWSQHKLLPPLNGDNASDIGERLPPTGYRWPTQAGDSWTIDYSRADTDSIGWLEKTDDQGHKSRHRRWYRIAVKLDES